jgi:hypothetical protein
MLRGSPNEDDPASLSETRVVANAQMDGELLLPIADCNEIRADHACTSGVVRLSIACLCSDGCLRWIPY